MNTRDAGFSFQFAAEGEEAVKRLLSIAMIAMLPSDALDEVFVPLKNAFATVYAGPYLPWEPVRLQVFSETVDQKTLKLLRRFQRR